MAGLDLIGWNDSLEEQFAEFREKGWIPSRVTSIHGKFYRVWTGSGEVLAEVPGKIRHRAESAAELPAIGDWVALELKAGSLHARIRAILPRKSRFSRKVAGEELEEQVIAANIDTLFILQSLDHNFNLRRAERYLLTAWESGANPVILLSKADLCEDPEGRAEEMRAVAIGVPVHIVSARGSYGIKEMEPYLKPGHTVAFVGSSGVGKSTLINLLLGSEEQKTREVREKDGRGRHTTTHRELFQLPSGCCLIDTPGMRELQLWSGSEGIMEAFPEIIEFTRSCRFTNCRHETEPGCRLIEAVANGEIQKDRVDSYLKLLGESEYQQSRTDDKLRRERKQKERAAHRVFRKVPNRRT